MKSLYAYCLMALLAVVSVRGQSEMKCHYSCANCTHPYHQYCRTCIDGYQFELVKNPADIPQEYRDTRVPTGVCLRDSTMLGGVNGLGIALLVSAFILIPVTRSNLLFYVASTLQSLGLIRLLEVSWLSPSSYLLRSFQYLSPCNLFTAEVKQNSWEIKLYSFYYLDEMYIQPQLEKSLLLVGSLDIAVIGLIILAHLIVVVKRKYFLQDCRALFCFAEWALKHQIAFLNCLFYFLIQETILSFVVSLQFTPANGFVIGTIVVYAVLMVVFCVYTYRVRIRLFQNRLVQYYSYAKKIIYPIFIVVPFQYQYFLLVLMGLNCALEAFFDYKIKSYLLRSRWMAYKILEFLTVLFLGIYFGIDSSAKTEGPPLAMNYALTVMLCLNVAFFFLEVVLSIRERLTKKKEEEEKVQVPEMSMLDRGQNNTLAMASTKREQRRESTESDLIENSQARQGVDKLNQSIDEPPKIERSDTKDSSFKKSKDEKMGEAGLDNIEQIEEVKMEKPEGKEAKDGKMSKDNSKKRHNKNREQLKSELKKRYGV